jgi:hypothetical protein
VTNGARKRLFRSRATLVALFLVALAPIAGAYFLYYSVRDEGPWGTSNRGTLLAPGTSAASMGVVEPTAEAALSRHWWLVLVADDACIAECAVAAERLRALQILLNKDAERLRRGVVLHGATAGDAFAALRRGDPRLVRLDGDFPGMTQGIYLIDPLGNVVLHYPYDQAGKPVLEDVKKLMKVSQIG